MTKTLISVLVLFLVSLNGCLYTPESETEMGHEASKDMRPGLAVPVLEPTTGDWVNDNTWGDQHTGPMPQTEGQEVQVIKNTNFYGPPAVHSVSLFRSDAVQAGNADLYAHITYGVGGVQNEFYCDWAQGAQFSITANSITVAAKTYRPDADNAYFANAASIFFGAMVAKGDASSPRPLTLTEGAITLIPGSPTTDNVQYNVPDFAVGFRLFTLPPDPTATDLDVDFVTGNPGNILAKVNGTELTGAREYPLPGATALVIVQNRHLTDARTVILQWVLGV